VPTVRVLRHVSDEFNVNFTEMSSDNRIYLNKRIAEIESSFEELKSVLEQMLSL